jgi:hypothetical protein
MPSAAYFVSFVAYGLDIVDFPAVGRYVAGDFS